MKGFIALALVTLCVLVICNDANAWPADSEKAKETKPKDMTKENKEAKKETKKTRDTTDVKSTATASKDVKDAIKNAKEAKKTRKECEKDCTRVAHDPICGHDPANPTFKPRTFGSQCALDVVNCEMGTKLVAKNKGPCAGSQGERLS